MPKIRNSSKDFLREARNAAKLKKHDNIVEAYDIGEDRGKYYFAMEFVEGHSLAEILYSKGKLKEKTALNILKQLTKALIHANRFSIIHRDIKPENIMISQEGQVKLCDLGLAKDLTDNFYKSGSITLGTAYYTSPEQAKGLQNLDIRTDIYSLGISFYHMLAGEVPFDDANVQRVVQRHINEALPSIKEKNPQIQQSTIEILNKMTEKETEKRYRDPEELFEDIDRVFHGINSLSISGRITKTEVTPEIPAILKKRKNDFRIFIFALHFILCSNFTFL